VCRVDTPPIIHGNVENTEGDDEECCRPFGLEANGDHNTCDEAEQRNERAPDAPLSLEDKAKEKEYEEDATREKEVFSAVILADARDTSEQFFARHHRVAEYHEKASNNRKVAEEKCHVKNETVAKPLNNDDREKTCDTVFCMALRYNCTRADDHRKDVDQEKEMRDSLREMPMLLQIPELVTPLCDDPERILQEGDDYQKATDCWEMRSERLRIYLHIIFDLLRVVTKSFDRVLWVGGPVSRRGP